MRTKWQVALKMGKQPSDSMKVCSKHFLPSDYFPGGVQKRKLFPHAVPSQNLPQRSHDFQESCREKNKKMDRESRANKRAERFVSATVTTGTVEQPEAKDQGMDQEDAVETPHLRAVLSVAVECNLIDFRHIRPLDSRSLADTLTEIAASEKCTQFNTLPLWEGRVPSEITKSLTLPELLINDQYLFTFTGIHSLDLLETLVSCVQDLDVEGSTNKKILPLRDRVILTMVKIKQNMSFIAIGVLFGINRQTCSNYFKNMCPILSRVLKSVMIWPDQELIRSNLPKSFKNYRATRIILDCAETELEKCKRLKCRILTYSQYKKKHTAKFNVGVAPSGLITELSVAYGGRASDKKIVVESKILDKCDSMDGVMTDKGFMIERECEERCLSLIRPPFLKKQKQMSRADALKNADIARARVHVERVIQRLRQLELLAGVIPCSLVPYFNDILVIGGGLTNLGPLS